MPRPVPQASPDGGGDNEINLTPMLDVVFIMLIFFIVTASFLRELGIDVNRPQAASVPPTVSTGILVSIDEQDAIWIAGRHIDARALRPNFARLGAENPDASVVVSAHPRSTTDALVAVLDSARAAGIYDIGLAPQHASPP